MKTLISGQAGLAIFVQGNEAAVISVEDRKEKRFPLSALNALLADSTDIRSFESISRSLAEKWLDFYWRSDRTLQLIIIILDMDESDDLVSEAAECLEEFFANTEVMIYVSNMFYAAPLPSNVNIERAIKLTDSSSPILNKFLKELMASQTSIKKFFDAWNVLPVDLFGSIELKNEFRQTLIEKGLFFSFVKTHNDSVGFANEHIRSLIELKDLPNFRQILNSWIKDLRPKKKELAVYEIAQAVEDEEEVIEKKKRIKVHEVLLNIEKQKNGIIDSIKKGRLDLARRYVEQLITMQRMNSEPEHIAKSLCDLAQEAKEVSNYPFQLELVQRAVDIAPDDGWAHGQLADAFFNLKKLDDALQSYQNTSIFGQEAFGLNGQARILLEQGRFEEAFDAYDRLRVQFPEEVTIWAGYAEVLRSMWWLEEALQAYDEAIKKFPYEKVLKCGRAATLTDMGRLSDAIEAYSECIKNLGEDEISVNGKGTVLRKMGEYDEALKWYGQGLKKFPESVALLYGRAKISSDQGRFSQALEEYEYICSTYSYETRAWVGKAEVLKELRQFDKAIKVYDQALERFSFNKWLCNGRASVYKKQGAYEKALQAYEKNLAKAPYDIIAKCGKADLLKELGQFEASLKTYDELIAKNPFRVNLKYAKASILIALGNYDGAKDILSIVKKSPSTRDDWIAYNIKGNLLLKTGQIEEAIAIFETALRKSPFVKDHKYFRNSLAVAQMRKKNFLGAIKLLPGEAVPVENIVRLHAWGEIAKEDKTKISEAKIALDCLEADCPPYLIPLMVELEKRYFSDIRESSDEWVFEQECNCGVLSASIS